MHTPIVARLREICSEMCSTRLFPPQSSRRDKLCKRHKIGGRRAYVSRRYLVELLQCPPQRIAISNNTHPVPHQALNAFANRGCEGKTLIFCL
jgi:hypothetical protein